MAHDAVAEPLRAVLGFGVCATAVGAPGPGCAEPRERALPSMSTTLIEPYRPCSLGPPLRRDNGRTQVEWTRSVFGLSLPLRASSPTEGGECSGRWQPDRERTTPRPSIDPTGQVCRVKRLVEQALADVVSHQPVTAVRERGLCEGGRFDASRGTTPRAISIQSARSWSTAR